MKRFAFLIIALGALLTACEPAATLAPTPQVLPTATQIPSTATPEPRTLTVFAAASLTGTFTEIGKAFEVTHPGVTVVFDFAGSQALRTQLEQGATADIFASANTTEMDNAVKDGLVGQGAPVEFASNLLVVILPAKNPGNVQTLADLAHPGLKIVLGDTTVPAGKYARQALDKLSKDPIYGIEFSSKVIANIVSNETDVKGVVSKVQLGEADAGIVYVTDALAAPELKTLEIPAKFNVTAHYPIAPLANAPKPDLAAEFIRYVLSSEGQAILKKWGFTPAIP